MPVYAVIDTNVLVSAMLSKKGDTATVKVINAVMSGEITPLYHPEILAEYEEVLHWKKFHLSESVIEGLLIAFLNYGIEVFPTPTGEVFSDETDVIFYEVAMEKREDDAWLVTGNMRHFPVRPFIVTPAEMVAILEEARQQSIKPS